MVAIREAWGSAETERAAGVVVVRSKRSKRSGRVAKRLRPAKTGGRKASNCDRRSDVIDQASRLADMRRRPRPPRLLTSSGPLRWAACFGDDATAAVSGRPHAGLPSHCASRVCLVFGQLCPVPQTGRAWPRATPLCRCGSTLHDATRRSLTAVDRRRPPRSAPRQTK